MMKFYYLDDPEVGIFDTIEEVWNFQRRLIACSFPKPEDFNLVDLIADTGVSDVELSRYRSGYFTDIDDLIKVMDWLSYHTKEYVAYKRRIKEQYK